MSFFKKLKLIWMKRNTRVYLSGKMSGLKNYGKENFDRAEKQLRQEGFTKIVNPYKLGIKLSKKLHRKLEDISYEEFLKNDLIELLKCNMIYMLENWADSRGCTIERKLAIDCNIFIMYERK